MKTKITTVGLCILMGVTALVFNGCKGKDGAPGAQGPEGNATVISDTATVPSWLWALAFGNQYHCSITDHSITQSIIDNGVVLVYEEAGINAWRPLPYTFTTTSRSCYFAVGFVYIESTNTDGTAPTNPGTIKYRIVVMSKRSMKSHPTVDYKNYAEVKQAFNLKD